MQCFEGNELLINNNSHISSGHVKLKHHMDAYNGNNFNFDIYKAEEIYWNMTRKIKSSKNMNDLFPYISSLFSLNEIKKLLIERIPNPSKNTTGYNFI